MRHSKKQKIVTYTQENKLLTETVCEAAIISMFKELQKKNKQRLLKCTENAQKLRDPWDIVHALSCI